MTLIVGIKCKDGIVMAADGAATLGNIAQKTALQPTKKLSILKDKIVIGVSGPVGLGQMLKGKMEAIWDDKLLSSKKPYEAMAVISAGFRESIIPEYKTATITKDAIGNAALSDAITNTVVAIPVSKKLCLFQFDHQGSPEETTEELPFVAIGSGQSIADPFLGFLRRICWAEHQPNINEGIFAAVWTLDHAIKVNPGGVAEPMQVISIPEDGEIKELAREELFEHRESVKSAEKAISESLSLFKKTMAGSAANTEIVPEPLTKK